MSDEYFYGVTLSSAETSETWDPFHADDNEEFGVWNKLLVKQILLGHEAKADEYHVVEVTTQTIDDAIKIPIAVLKVGETRTMNLNLEFVAPVIFKLVQGSGPVHIHGQHLIGEPQEPNDTDIWDEKTMLEEEEDEEEDFAGEEEGENGSTRRKQKFPNSIKAGGSGNAADIARNKRKL